MTKEHILETHDLMSNKIESLLLNSNLWLEPNSDTLNVRSSDSCLSLALPCSASSVFCLSWLWSSWKWSPSTTFYSSLCHDVSAWLPLWKVFISAWNDILFFMYICVPVRLPSGSGKEVNTEMKSQLPLGVFAGGNERGIFLFVWRFLAVGLSGINTASHNFLSA